MSGVFDLKITGLNELLKELQGLERKIFDKAMNKTVRAGAKVIQKAARENAPVRSNEWEGANYPNPPGTLKKGIAIAKASRQPPTIVRYQVGFAPKAWYGHLVERGHKLVRAGKTIGHVPAHPFLRPAFDNNVQKVIEEMKTTLRGELDKLK